ncbi:MAG: hypothetical protein J1E56_05500 [Ruminococcus sp.]|nr:hypothetical protein [Ruminococcus sp.]
MSRKLKPQFLVIGIILGIAVVGLFIFLFILVSNKTSNAYTETQPTSTIGATAPVQLTETEPDDIYQEYSTEPYTVYQKHSTIPEPESLEQIIINEGLRVNNGKVINADGIEYTVNFGAIKLIYNDNLYTISVDMIKKVTELADEEPTTEKPTEKATEKPKKSQKSSSSASSSKTNKSSSNNTNSQSSYNNNSNSANSNNYTPSPQVQEPVIEQPAVEKPVQKPTEKPKGNNSNNTVDNSIRLNYKSLTINKDSIFTLTLSGANNNVAWYISDRSIISEYEKSGNQCSFKTISKGQTTVTANYNGTNYICTITVN